MRKPIFWAFAALLAACNSPTASSVKQRPPDSMTMIPTDTMIQTTDTTVIASLVESWKRFEHYNGKYAADINLLQLAPVKDRLKALLGEAGKDFAARYKVTPPIEIQAGILYNEGCMPHSCTVNEAALAIDMKKDILYVGIANNKVVKLYGERGDTLYPEKLLQWMMKFEE